MCARLLDVMIENGDQDAWELLDIPMETWEGMADLFRSPDPVIGTRRAKFLVLLEAAVAESMASGADDDPHGIEALAPFWVQALRIGAVNNQGRILTAIDHWLGSVSVGFTGRERDCFMSLIGWAREAATPRLCFG